MTHTHAFGRTALDERSACCRDLYWTRQDIHKGQTPMPPARFEPATPVSERPQTHVVNLTASGIDWIKCNY